MKSKLLCSLHCYGFNKRRLSCGQLLIFWKGAESNPGYVHDIVMYTTCLEDRCVSGSCVNFIWFLWHLSKLVDISWIHSLHCYVYNKYRREVCWWFLCEIVINIVMYITSVFSTCWWYFQRVSCGRLVIFCESAESNPGYVHDIVMYTACLKDRYVGDSCVNFIWFLSHLSKPVDISWICSWNCYVYNVFRIQVRWWFLSEIVINNVIYITSVFSTCWWYFQRFSCGQ